MSDTDVICGAEAHKCKCVLPPGHEDPVHVCRDQCGGSWSGEYGGEDFEVVSWPCSGMDNIPAEAAAILSYLPVFGFEDD